MQNNVVASVPFALGELGQSIATYVNGPSALLAQAAASPIQNVTIRNNTVINSRVRSYQAFLALMHGSDGFPCMSM